jgi:cell division transport system permease protein
MVISIAILFMFSVSLLFQFNVGYLAAAPGKQATIHVALSKNITNQQQQELVEQVKKLPNVKNAVFVPKEQGLRQMKEQWGKESKKVFQGMEVNNPLPDLIIVYPQNQKELQKLEKALEQFKGVDQVRVGYSLR